MNKTLLVVIVIIAAAAGFWLWNSNKSEKTSLEPAPGAEGLPQLPEVSGGDTTKGIQQDLDQIDLGDIDKQFENIDAGLNNL